MQLASLYPHNIYSFLYQLYLNIYPILMRVSVIGGEMYVDRIYSGLRGTGHLFPDTEKQQFCKFVPLPFHHSAATNWTSPRETFLLVPFNTGAEREVVNIVMVNFHILNSVLWVPFITMLRSQHTLFETTPTLIRRCVSA